MFYFNKSGQLNNARFDFAESLGNALLITFLLALVLLAFWQGFWVLLAFFSRWQQSTALQSLIHKRGTKLANRIAAFTIASYALSGISNPAFATTYRDDTNSSSVSRPSVSLLLKGEKQTESDAHRLKGPVLLPKATSLNTYRVKPGDSLWKIAESLLQRSSPQDPPSAREVQVLVEQIYQQNLTAIGSNPNLIFPGTSLVLPKQPTRQKG
ncbi:hypothetical protein BSR28_07705 [Boudabousia liubingyangii]|nr:hypothetical protein BSR28_07705 [Boudabousia liubingyangii]